MSPVTVIAFCSIFIASTNGACNIIEHGVSRDEELIIVNKHNSLRTMLAEGRVPNQPRAINMQMMVYDSALGQAAQSISDTYVFQHVSVNDPRWWWVGQNIYMTMSTDPSSGANWEDCIQNWFNEHVNYTYPAGASSKTGHYTQVAWADSTHIGCGYTYFETDGQNPYQKIFACNYGPGGNVNGLPPYQTA